MRVSLLDLIFKAIILGVVEGVTEFLPISSTGHLIIAGHFLGFSGPFSILFDIIIQLGAILAVIVYYRNRLYASLINLRPGQWGMKFWLLIFVAFLPSAIIGLVFNQAIEKFLFSPLVVSIAMIAGALLILIVEKLVTRKSRADLLGMKFSESFLIGLSQCMALIPGMSRSASTMIGGLLIGLSAKAAAEFSFFLAIPTMFAATGFSLVKASTALTANEWIALAIGFAVSFLVAYLVVGKFLNYLSKHNLAVFAYYRLIIGCTFVVLIALNVF
jgi:undecaprenyl-diphosphatase